MPGVEDIKEKEFYGKFNVYQQYRAEIDARLKQRELVANTITEVSASIATLEDIKKLAGGEEIMVPLGSGAFISAALKDSRKVLFDLGAETFTKKTTGEVIENLKGRETELQKVLDSLNQELMQLEKYVNELGLEIEKLAAGMKQPGP